MALTAQQLQDVRDDLGGADTTVFTDVELQNLHVRSGGWYAGTVALAHFQLLNGSAKWASFKAGEVSVDKSKLFDQMWKVFEAVHKPNYAQIDGPAGIISGSIDKQDGYQEYAD